MPLAPSLYTFHSIPPMAMANRPGIRAVNNKEKKIAAAVYRLHVRRRHHAVKRECDEAEVDR